MKICVYAICKNEEAVASRWLKSVEEADAIYVSDTGSTDKTIEILQAHPKVHLMRSQYTGEAFRFDYARNESLAMIPEDTDICIHLDLDEFFIPGWRKNLEEYLTGYLQENPLKPDTVLVLQSHFFNINPYQNLNKITPKCKFSGFSYTKAAHYIRAVHEDLVFPNQRIVTVTLPINLWINVHLPSFEDTKVTKKEDLYMALAQKELETFPSYRSTLIYLMAVWGGYLHQSNSLEKKINWIKNFKQLKAQTYKVLNQALSAPLAEQNDYMVSQYGELNSNATHITPLPCLLLYYFIFSEELTQGAKYALIQQIIEAFKSYSLPNWNDLAYFSLALQNIDRCIQEYEKL